MSIDHPPSDDELARKAERIPRRLVRAMLEKALLLRELWRDPEVPVWAKALIVAALAYFLCPLDAIPDFLPGGFADDLAALSALLASLAAHIRPRHRDAAEVAAERWLPPAS